jgi:hypothetical protein
MAEYYRVEADGTTECPTCKQPQMVLWTIVDADDVAIGESWGSQELAQNICSYMNMAFACTWKMHSKEPK